MKKKRVIPILMCMLLITGSVASANTLNYPKTDYKDISTSETSGSNTFPYSKPYSDNYGYTGTYYKDRSSQVIRGSASEYKYVTVTIDSSYNNFNSSTFYNEGGYSGSLRKDGPVKNDSKSKKVSGVGVRAQQFNKKCTHAGRAQPNDYWDPAKFDPDNKATHQFFEIDTVWSSEYHAGYGEDTPKYFYPTYSGVNLDYVYYDDGEYSGGLSHSLSDHRTEIWPVYMLTPKNGYTPPHLGQQCKVRTETYTYNFRGTVTAPSN